MYKTAVLCTNRMNKKGGKIKDWVMDNPELTGAAAGGTGLGLLAALLGYLLAKKENKRSTAMKGGLIGALAGGVGGATAGHIIGAPYKKPDPAVARQLLRELSLNEHLKLKSKNIPIIQSAPLSDAMSEKGYEGWKIVNGKMYGAGAAFPVNHRGPIYIQSPDPLVSASPVNPRPELGYPDLEKLWNEQWNGKSTE